ncbi:N-acetylmuramoyl-L-alanine amidase [Myxococcus faecalis]|jgi:N-acetylmuramoyl-L-alanine amidase|uniref:N-acetylmuramoyl-L-alanine amidase n=1 Tax=Myxococcus TaxID=32 RepID=UPI001CBBAD10|nr:N-acetylmuramoyl-L-alanine amidase [Myxococcus sp. XM-1-1-1]MBZ4410704.1 N-acetylmuramoyl-L-alanine amidase [Myxococcus sp. XM-1-1-1]BDT34561.1 N-acetylmuramoyl-L-alanine amidase [Myxococcus sp. MH1]
MSPRLLLALILLLLVPGTVGAAKRNEAEDAYQGARRAYYALKDDAARRKLRHHWLNVVHKFQAVAKAHPKSDRAPDALFTAGELLQELSRISFVEEDLKAAIADYDKLRTEYPKHRLADDAALALARIHVHRTDRPEEARRVLTEMLAVNSKGDQTKEMKALLASLPASKVTPPPARKPTPTPVPAKEDKGTAVAHVETPAEKPASALVGAIEKLAREPSPIIPRLDPTTPVGGEPSGESKGGLDAAVASALAAKESQTSKPVETGKVASVTKPAEPASQPTPAVDVKPSAPVEVASAKSETPRAQERRPEPEPVKVAEAPKAEQKSPVEPPKPITRPVDDEVAQARLKAVAKQSRRAELTLAEQLGLKVRRVIIDPGHGGHDTGAIGKEGTREKEVALSISLKLADLLREKGLEVVLTREDDRFIRLEDRAKFANTERGDLFISVHCNAATSRKLRGIETYTLNTSADRYSIRLAARENASSEKGISDLQFILADLATKANTEESSRLANQVQRSLVTELSRKYSDIKGLGHKEALFYVLLGVKMPAILVETAFLSNPEEEKRLASGAYQTDVAKAIAHGVEEFLGDRNRVAKVD